MNSQYKNQKEQPEVKASRSGQNQSNPADHKHTSPRRQDDDMENERNTKSSQKDQDQDSKSWKSPGR